MPKCPFCLANVWSNQEQVLYLPKENSLRRKRAHLACYLREKFTLPATNECNLSDAVTIHPDGLCNWCRGPQLTARMSRTGQEICPSCAKIVTQLFENTEAVNRPDDSQ